MQQFSDWLEVVKQYNHTTSRGYVKVVSRALRSVPAFDYPHVLQYLKELRRTVSPGYYSEHLGALKHFTRFIGQPGMLAEFSHPPKQLTPKTFWKREQVVAFYNALTILKMKALFLMGATTGLRKGEMLSLRIDEIDHNTRMTDEQVAALNLRLQQLGFATLGDYARALTEGVVGSSAQLASRALARRWGVGSERP